MESWSRPFLIMFTVPLGFLGMYLTLYIMNMSMSMIQRLRGEYFEESENLDEYVKNVNAMASIPLDYPMEHSICSILTFASDPGLSAVEGARIELYEGWDESILATRERVCLIPADEVELWPEGTVNVMRPDGYSQPWTSEEVSTMLTAA